MIRRFLVTFLAFTWLWGVFPALATSAQGCAPLSDGVEVCRDGDTIDLIETPGFVNAKLRLGGVTQFLLFTVGEPVHGDAAFEAFAAQSWTTVQAKHSIPMQEAPQWREPLDNRLTITNRAYLLNESNKRARMVSQYNFRVGDTPVAALFYLQVAGGYETMVKRRSAKAVSLTRNIVPPSDQLATEDCSVLREGIAFCPPEDLIQSMVTEDRAVASFKNEFGPMKAVTYRVDFEPSQDDSDLRFHSAVRHAQRLMEGGYNFSVLEQRETKINGTRADIAIYIQEYANTSDIYEAVLTTRVHGYVVSLDTFVISDDPGTPDAMVALMTDALAHLRPVDNE